MAQNLIGYESSGGGPSAHAAISRVTRGNGPTNPISGDPINSIVVGSPNRFNMPLKAQKNSANGGIGVSYSNVILAGPE